MADSVPASIRQFLDSEGIKYELKDGFICVDRDSMVNWPQPFVGENEAYALVMEAIKAHIDNPKARVYWGFKNDDWIGIEIHVRG